MEGTPALGERGTIAAACTDSCTFLEALAGRCFTQLRNQKEYLPGGASRGGAGVTGGAVVGVWPLGTSGPRLGSVLAAPAVRDGRGAAICATHE